MRTLAVGLILFYAGVCAGVWIALSPRPHADTPTRVPADEIPCKHLYTDSNGDEHAECKSQSWDQENLKKDDHGCPTAVFIAPQGELIQCPPQ